MDIKKHALKGGIWLAGLTSISQVISWIATITVANLLVPEDYGLMTMAGFLTAYIEYLSDMGIGAAVVQKKEITQKELSSLFWLALSVGFFFAVLALFLAYPTSLIFNEKRIIPVTYLISINFIIGSFSSISNGILRRDFKFKEIGIANMIGAIISCISQVIMAAQGFGVYTLVIGVIILRTTKTILTFIFSNWTPSLHFKFSDIKSYYKFGLGLAGGAALFRLYETLDKFIVGKIFNAKLLGNYSFAFSLANLPMEKIVPIFQQVTFPLLSRLQHDVVDRNKTFLLNIKMCFYLTGPLYFGGAIVGHDIIVGFLGEKWIDIVPMFRIFCLVIFLEFINSFCNTLFNSIGNSEATLKLNVIRLLFMPVSIFVAARYGYSYLIIPWSTIYPIILIAWTFYTLKVFKISINDFMSYLSKPFVFSIVFAICCVVSKFCMVSIFGSNHFVNNRIMIIVSLCIGAGMSIVYLHIFDRDIITNLLALRKQKSS